MSEFVCITDRTQADVDRVKYLTNAILTNNYTQEEFLEFQSDLKGALNYSDLSRIEGNINIIASLIGMTPANMTYDGIPRVPYFKVLLANIKSIKDLGYRYSTTPKIPNMPLNTFGKINDIEKILLDAYTVYTVNEDSHVRCGEGMYCNNALL